METPEARYDALVDRVDALYVDGQITAALDVMAAEPAGLEPWVAELSHLKACLLALSGDADAALRMLQEASAIGAWWEPAILTDDDDLEALQGRPEFQQLVALSSERMSDDPTPPVITLPAVPVVGTVVGIVVALHGAGQRATHAARDWAGVLELGYALVCVESSHRSSSMYRTWPDREQAINDIARALDALPAELSGVPIIAAGFSAGGRAALDWALTARPTQPAGALLMAPALRQLPDTAAGKLSPATIWIGTDDNLLEVVANAEDRLTTFGFTIERVPGLAHTFPEDFSGQLARELQHDRGGRT